MTGLFLGCRGLCLPDSWSRERSDGIRDADGEVKDTVSARGESEANFQFLEPRSMLGERHQRAERPVPGRKCIPGAVLGNSEDPACRWSSDRSGHCQAQKATSGSWCGRQRRGGARVRARTGAKEAWKRWSRSPADHLFLPGVRRVPIGWSAAWVPEVADARRPWNQDNSCRFWASGRRSLGSPTGASVGR